MAAKLVAEEQTKERLCQELNLLVQNSAHAQVDALDALTHRLQALSAAGSRPGARPPPPHSSRINPQRLISIRTRELPNTKRSADETADTSRVRESCMGEVRHRTAGDSRRTRY